MTTSIPLWCVGILKSDTVQRVYTCTYEVCQKIYFEIQQKLKPLSPSK